MSRYTLAQAETRLSEPMDRALNGEGVVITRGKARVALGPLIMSNFAAAEFSCVIARQVRTGERTRDEASILLERFDLWAGQTITR